MKFLNTLALISIAIFGSNAMKDISSNELLKDLKIGWSLGNTLDAQCIDQIDYSQDQLASETCWGNVKTTPQLYNKLNELGFNIFRIPTTWSGHFGEGPEYKINDQWMKRVHEVVDYALNTGSYAILNIHHETWNHAFSNNLESAKTILVAIWKQIAAEFAEYDEHLIFEGLNEPRKVNTDVEWNGGDKEGWDFVNEMNALFVNTIRSTGGNNALRHLMIPTYAASVNDNAIANYKFPSNDDKLIVSLHAYTPYNFALDQSETAVSTFNKPEDIDWVMKLIKSNFRDKNIPVIMGEFGAMNRDNEEERAKWAEYYIKSAKAIGVPCVLWDNGIFEGDGERFGIIDRASLRVAYPQLVEGLMKGLGESSSSSATAEPVPEPLPEQEQEQEPTTENNNNVDYFSCASNDWICKAKMSDKCFKEVFNCFVSKKGNDICHSINKSCGRIWD
ncbi:endoglucanase B [Anaeromyces robustus]|uniref:Endoglucanase B n=1 Tax=Anaeromyces robustus TaxID=1754192 RepID=A0A1Y1VTE7_9FUNG|nr:endoglucanase B [Anaeromyces robustus]|eukprot:ORX64570.1 endoglucanase B [Anaeromyces robustus]